MAHRLAILLGTHGRCQKGGGLGGGLYTFNANTNLNLRHHTFSVWFLHPRPNPTGGAENSSTGKRKYGKCKYNANLHSDKKNFGTSQVSVVHFQVGGQVDYRLFFF